MAEEQDKSYLAIRNWGKFQSTTDKHGKSLEGRRRIYILDYCEKETDSLYASLTVFQRYMLDGCRRLRGKHGCNVKNDFMWIVRQLDVSREERHNATRALGQLIERGLLIPTNEQFSFPPKPETPIELPNTDKATNSDSVIESIDELNRKETPNPSGDVESGRSKRQDSLRDDRSSEGNTKSKDKSNTNPISDSPDSASPRKRDALDKYKLADTKNGLAPLIYTQWVEEKPPRFLKDLLGETPTAHEINSLLKKTDDSADTILAVVKWGLEVSNHWFKTQDGVIRTYTDLANAYPEMAKQYRNYHKKGANA